MDLQEQKQQSKENVEKCQKEKAFQSCLQCPQVLECAIRKKYVENVYVFLNGGQKDSDFDF